jgi:hypothetical protein
MPHLFRVIVPVGRVERAALFYSALLGATGSGRRRVGTTSSPREQYLPATIPRPRVTGTTPSRYRNQLLCRRRS